MKRLLLISLIMAILLVACGGEEDQEITLDLEDRPTAESDASEEPSTMGMGGSMMERHHAPIPEEYSGMANTIEAVDDSLNRGAEFYKTHCATCHGDGGMGDGPGGSELNPAPAAVAHTSQMMGDDYLFYRISEGGGFSPFNSAMPAWKATLDEDARWDVINYIRALGSGQVMPDRHMGGRAFDPQEEAIKHEQMARQGVEAGIITQEEADVFLEVHAHLDVLMASDMERMGGMVDMQSTMLGMLIDEGSVSQEQADIFSTVHEKLLDAGLME